MQEFYFKEFRMKLYVQLMILFVISLIGEGISSFFHLPIPGSIIGLIILFIALQFKSTFGGWKDGNVLSTYNIGDKENFIK